MPTLTRAVVDSARSLGGELAMPATFVAASLTDDGVAVTFESGGSDHRMPGAGTRQCGRPMGDGGRTRRPARHPVPDVDLVQGTHIVVAHARDQRHLLRRKPERRTRGIRHALAGSHLDRHHRDSLITASRTRSQPLPEEEEYLLAVARRYFPAARGDDPRGHPCGASRDCGCCRPPPSRHSTDRARRIFTTDRDPHPRVLGIYGGKLTGWRAAAAQVLARIGPSLTAKPRRAATDQLVLRRVYMIKYGIAALGLALLAASAHADGDYVESDQRPGARVARRHATSISSTTLQVDSSTGVPGTYVNGGRSRSA